MINYVSRIAKIQNCSSRIHLTFGSRRTGFEANDLDYEFALFTTKTEHRDKSKFRILIVPTRRTFEIDNYV